ncbi:rhodanese-like domain-containing protein [Geomonas silvestris]|uniref:rhodanese-like domain-containing protein n=1 Tax=Geomonas silvestris TaxID=2740184 RepID=UPI0035308334
MCDAGACCECGSTGRMRQYRYRQDGTVTGRASGSGIYRVSQCRTVGHRGVAAQSLGKGLVIIDTRSAAAYGAGHIPGAINFSTVPSGPRGAASKTPPSWLAC